MSKSCLLAKVVTLKQTSATQKLTFAYNLLLTNKRPKTVPKFLKIFQKTLLFTSSTWQTCPNDEILRNRFAQNRSKNFTNFLCAKVEKTVQKHAKIGVVFDTWRNFCATLQNRFQIQPKVLPESSERAFLNLPLGSKHMSTNLCISSKLSHKPPQVAYVPFELISGHCSASSTTLLYKKSIYINLRQDSHTYGPHF